ncbi:hypothetical protein J6590_093365 [Homalodisca vitripennis]|nr:hypothetical protein J6590_093365 [Homalodisca vitripennis]
MILYFINGQDAQRMSHADCLTVCNFMRVRLRDKVPLHACLPKINTSKGISRRVWRTSEPLTARIIDSGYIPGLWVLGVLPRHRQ